VFLALEFHQDGVAGRDGRGLVRADNGDRFERRLFQINRIRGRCAKLGTGGRDQNTLEDLIVAEKGLIFVFAVIIAPSQFHVKSILNEFRDRALG